jgi:serine/threonine protein kinase
MHPNIVQVLDVGEVGGALYLAMEYVHGKDLRDIIKMLQARGDMVPLGLGCHIVREVAQALHHAYWSTDMEGKRMSVVHRDVSPHNIIISFDGAVKLLDFGVAASSVTEEDEQMIVGKWMYMSPEHTTKKIDHRSDLFSLGVVLYLLCSGRMPFAGANELEVIDRIAEGDYARLTGIPPALAQLVYSMISPEPNDRPQSGQAVAAALSDIARTHRLEGTTTDLAAFVKNLFVDELAASEATSAITEELDEEMVMDITTIRLAVGSSPTQAQNTPAAGLLRQPAVTPTGLLVAAPATEVSFSPPIPVAPSSPLSPPISPASKIWLAAAIAVVVGIVVLLIATR